MTLNKYDTKKIIQLLNDGELSYSQISKIVGCHPSLVEHYAKKIGISRRFKIPEIKLIEEYYNSGHNLTECSKHFKISMTFLYSARLRGELNIPLPSQMSLDELLTFSNKRLNGKLRSRIISSKIIDYKCSNCGLTDWLNNKISLELHHDNGNPLDNRIENLRFLCPNCHSQTPTYRKGLNK